VESDAPNVNKRVTMMFGTRRFGCKRICCYYIYHYMRLGPTVYWNVTTMFGVMCAYDKQMCDDYLSSTYSKWNYVTFYYNYIICFI